MARPIFNDGHYTNATGFQFESDTRALEDNERLLSLVSTFGVSSGFLVTDDSVPSSNNKVDITAGLGYDSLGIRVKLSSAFELSGVVPGDVNSFVVAENVASGVASEAHPKTGAISDTKEVDTTTLSVVTGASASQIVLAKITSVVTGGSPSIGLSTVDRNVLTITPSSPFAVVGNEGDAAAEFRGNDAQPFNSAITGLIGNGGGYLFVRAGTYEITAANPILASGTAGTSLVIQGSGEGTIIKEAAGNDLSLMTVDGLASITIRDCLFQGIAAGPAIPRMFQISNIGRFRFEDNFVTGEVGNALTFVSSVETSIIRGNKFSFGGQVARYVSGASATTGAHPGNCDQLMMTENVFDQCSIGLSDHIRHVSIIGNTFREGKIQRITPISGASNTFTFPDTMVISDNIGSGVGSEFRFEITTPRTICNGNVMLGNSKIIVSGVGSQVVNNTIFQAAADECLVVRRTNCLIAGNVISGGGSTTGILLGTLATGNVVDNNIITVGSTSVLDLGSNNYATLDTNQTTNRTF